MNPQDQASLFDIAHSLQQIVALLRECVELLTNIRNTGLIALFVLGGIFGTRIVRRK